MKLKKLNQSKLILISSLFFLIFHNVSFFENVTETYKISSNTILPLISIPLFLFAAFVIFYTLLSSKYTTKPILIFTILTASFASYFMNVYHVVIDDEMIRNTLQTDMRESADLFSLRMILYVFFLGILPAIFVYKVEIEYYPLKKEIWRKVRNIGVSLLVILAITFSFSKFYASFFREHKSLRYYVNPVFWMYNTGNYFVKLGAHESTEITKIGEDAKIVETGKTHKPELIILVVGEAARADRFSLNGYERETNPELKKQKDIVNFSKMYSCGTSTAVSVPCMFSMFGKAHYSYKKGRSTENVLDVLSRTQKVAVLWRDNNSDSKGVALRVPFQDYKTATNNTMCDDVECRDEGMLVGLDKFIKDNEGKNILIVLHQMGNHGPAYYKRYPKSFEKFTPVCQTNQLENCSAQQIGNAYDNAILYTDYFLSKTIDFLKPYSASHETMMFYLSDHGESLGENGVYLHGMPYFMAPESQKHVGSLMWLGSIQDEIDIKKLSSDKDKEFSQDNLFHTLLGLFGVDSKVYNKDQDMLRDARKN